MNSEKKIIFAGTPEFAAQSLQALIAAGFSIELVLTQPDRPAGRGRSPKASEVKRVALANEIPVWQPASLKGEEPHHKIRAVGCDFMVVVAYGLIIPELILNEPKYACINVHASLLPRWRGAAPIQRCIEAGDPYTGVCIMQMDPGLDTGPVVSKVSCPIEPNQTSGQLHDQLATMGADALVESITNWEQKRPIAQRHEESTYAKKIEKSEAEIHWSDSAEVISRRVRAFNPWPVCFTGYQGAPEQSVENLRIWEASVTHFEGEQSKPGTVVELSSEGVKVATGEGVLRITRVQKSGAKPMSVGALLNGHPDFFKVGQVLGSVSS